MVKVVIASAARTPFGSFQGALSPLKASELGAVVVRETVSRAGLSGSEVGGVYLGNVLSAGMGQAPARQAVRYAGLPDRVPAVTVSKVCGSGLEAVIQAYRAVALGDAEFIVAGGMESMSNAPYLLPGARGGLRLGNHALIDSLVHDGLWDVYNDLHMGSCAERCAREYAFSREAQDAYAATSYRRAQRAVADGAFSKEIVPVEVRGRRGEVTTLSEDEGPARVDYDKIPTLRPAFEKEGTVTAANASTINDGAAALLITSEAVAKARGLPILGSITGYAGHARAPEAFPTAPLGAMGALYEKLELKPHDVDLYEINEAFAVVPMAAIEAFGLPPERVNVHGGAVALGHPIGASGARLLVTLLNALERHDKELGMASICIGGGEALALTVTRGG